MLGGFDTNVTICVIKPKHFVHYEHKFLRRLLVMYQKTPIDSSASHRDCELLGASISGLFLLPTFALKELSHLQFFRRELLREQSLCIVIAIVWTITGMNVHT